MMNATSKRHILRGIHVIRGMELYRSLRSVNPFFAQLTAQCPYTLQWGGPPLSSLKIALSHGGSGPPYIIHDSVGPPELTTDTASRSVYSFLQGSWMWHWQTQTDRTTRPVTIGCI